jgi:hypothetical protein
LLSGSEVADICTNPIWNFWGGKSNRSLRST